MTVRNKIRDKNIRPHFIHLDKGRPFVERYIIQPGVFPNFGGGDITNKFSKPIMDAGGEFEDGFKGRRGFPNVRGF